MDKIFTRYHAAALVVGVAIGIGGTFVYNRYLAAKLNLPVLA